jgi:hypothetical protein
MILIRRSIDFSLVKKMMKMEISLNLKIKMLKVRSQLKLKEVRVSKMRIKFQWEQSEWTQRVPWNLKLLTKRNNMMNSDLK